MDRERVKTFFERVAASAARRPWIAISAVVSLALVGGWFGLGLRADAGTDTLLDSGSASYRSTESFRKAFGDDAALILAREDLSKLLTGEDLRALFELETCLAGGTRLGSDLPRQPGRPLPEVCERIEELAPARAIYGPASFLYQSVDQISSVLRRQVATARTEAGRAAESARQRALSEGLSSTEADSAAQEASDAVLKQFNQAVLRLALSYGITGVPRLDDPSFIGRVVFDSQGNTKSQFAQLFPRSDVAQITIRPRPDLTDAERDRMVALYREALANPRFALSTGDYVFSGAPVLIGALTSSIRSQMLLLLGVSVLVMAIALAFVMPPPFRLLPLGVALSATGILFGLLALFGGSLTISAIAMLPVLVGLSVDYAIQVQARFSEAREKGLDSPSAVVEAAGVGGPVLALACLATMTGFASFGLSASPLVRSFGFLLVAGIAIALGIALWSGLAVLSRDRGSAPVAGGGPATTPLRRWVSNRLRKPAQIAIATSLLRPGRVLLVAGALALCGLIASTQTPVDADVRDLAPSNSPELEELREVERTTGISGEIDVLVTSDDLADPATIAWMADFQKRVLARHGFSGPSASCDRAALCPAPSLTDLFAAAGGTLDRAGSEALIESIPPYLSEAVVTRDPETGEVGNQAVISFGVKVRPLDEQQALIEDIREQVDPPGGPSPPAGVTVEVAGLQVLIADANASLERSRWWLPAAGIGAVALILLLLWRSLRRTLAVLVPVVFATGWSSLAVASTGYALNPMSATLGALVIAVSTEFSIILASRFWEERSAGLTVGEALRSTYSRAGFATLASGATVIAGFAVLAVAGPLGALGLPSVAPILSGFGLVTVVDLLVALAAVLLVIPASLTLFDPLTERSSRGERATPFSRAGGSPG